MYIKKQPVKPERENKVLTFIPGLKSEVFPFALIKKHPSSFQTGGV